MTDFRTETDLLGEAQVPARALYGVHTERARLNFGVSGRTIGDYPDLIRALAVVKKAAAAANEKAGLLEARVAGAIREAADRVAAGEHAGEFPIDPLHGGGGTSANMNMNEVLANLAEEALGGRRGEYRLVHPNNHVNLHQSTNDVYPTAVHLAVLYAWPRARAALERMEDTLDAKTREFEAVVKLARTCLQDAVPISLGAVFSGYRDVVQRRTLALGHAVDDLHWVSLGGTIVGTGQGAHPEYLARIEAELREAAGLPSLTIAKNLVDAFQNPDDLAAVAAQLDLLARVLVKIGGDLRLMASGPEAGLGELSLPEVQAGSSIMPGKVNPVMPELLMQVCFQVMGHAAAARVCLDHGELDLPVWESVLLFNILDSFTLLESACPLFIEKCLAGIRADAARCDAAVRTIIPLLTELMEKHGYQAIAAACAEAKKEGREVREVLREKGYIE